MAWKGERNSRISLRQTPLGAIKSLWHRLKMEVPDGATELEPKSTFFGIPVLWQPHEFGYFAKNKDTLGHWMDLQDEVTSAHKEVAWEVVAAADSEVMQYYYPEKPAISVVFGATQAEGRAHPIRKKTHAEMKQDLQNAGYAGMPIGMSVESPWDISQSLVVPVGTPSARPLLLVSDSEEQVNRLWSSVMRGVGTVADPENVKGYFFAPGEEPAQTVENVTFMTAGDVNMTLILQKLADLGAARAKGYHSWGWPKDILVMFHDFGASYSVYPEGLHNRGTIGAIAALAREWPAIGIHPVVTMSSGEWLKFKADKRFGEAQTNQYDVFFGKTRDPQSAEKLVGAWRADEMNNMPEGMIMNRHGRKWWLLDK